MKDIHKANGYITCIPNNAEKYISFSIAQLKFVDSFQFMASSLGKLADATDKAEFKITKKKKKEFGDKTDVILRKGVYPYEYVNRFDRFNETKLPPIEKFYITLNNEGISKDKYAHAQKVCKLFNFKFLGDYHDLYLKTDVMLLADVFQTFRKTCMDAYKLDPLHYYTAPAYPGMLYSNIERYI